MKPHVFTLIKPGGEESELRPLVVSRECWEAFLNRHLYTLPLRYTACLCLPDLKHTSCVAHMHEACCTYGWVMSHVCEGVMSNVCEGVMSHVCEGVMSHVCEGVMSHVCEGVMSHVCEGVMSHVCEGVMSRMWMSHVTHMDEAACHAYHWVVSCGAYECALAFFHHVTQRVVAYSISKTRVTLHTCMRHVTRMNESCHTYECAFAPFHYAIYRVVAYRTSTTSINMAMQHITINSKIQYINQPDKYISQLWQCNTPINWAMPYINQLDTYSRLQIGSHRMWRLLLKTFNLALGVPGFSWDLSVVPFITWN